MKLRAELRHEPDGSWFVQVFDGVVLVSQTWFMAKPSREDMRMHLLHVGKRRAA